MDLEPIDIGRLEEAVVIFYRSTSQEQALTHEWLTKAETSPQAWQFSWQLMQLEKVKDFYDIFFFFNVYIPNLYFVEPRSAIFWRNYFALKANEALARGASWKPRRAKAEDIGNNCAICFWTQTGTKSTLSCGKHIVCSAYIQAELMKLLAERVHSAYAG